MDENQTEENGQNNRKTKFFPIVAIGASAGGIEAVTELLQNLSANTGMAYVYIQHLDIDHKSALVPILQRVTQMKVREVTQDMQIEANQLFIIPGNTNMTIKDGHFMLAAREPLPARHTPIDEFFLSLAGNTKEGAIGIILSGTASDGTLGLKAIKQAGGLAYAQDDSALFQSMPKSAVAENAVDAVLSPAKIAGDLQSLSKKGDLLQRIFQKDSEEEEQSEVVYEKDYTSFSPADVVSLLTLVKGAIGVNFMNYKTNTIRRRIAKRMLLHRLETLPDYIEFCKKNRQEIDILYQDLLINVTHFFRDKEATDYLQKELLPDIIKDKGANDSLRIWVPACSTGEEAYSMAIMILEIVENKNFKRPIQIFATDLSETAIAKARLGLYTISDVAGVSEKRLERFFAKVDGHYRIAKRIRDICVFAPHNILKDPPFSKVDLISCCNLLIYLDSSLQKKLMVNFHYGLNKKGYLVLGKSETVGSSSHLFSPVHKKLKIYSKKSDVPSSAIYDLHFQNSIGENIRTRPLPNPVVHLKESDNLEKTIDAMLLTQYVPAGVVINYDFDILLFRGSIGLFLEPLPGKASLNLLKMARPGLDVELRNAVSKAIKAAEQVKVSGLSITHKGNIHHVAFEVTPIVLHSQQKLLLIVFEEVKTPSPAELKVNFSKDRRVKQLETEMIALREDLRSIVEEHETANEELQSANEEIVSSNEELQSINEELETSKEELESTNEELMTINQELEVKNEQLAEAHEYTQNVIATIREAVIVLDYNLRVRAANQAFYKTFNVKEEETEGLLIYEIRNNQWNIPKLKELLEITVPKTRQAYGFELTHKFEGIGEKVLLLNVKTLSQASQNVEFILLAIEDITEHRQAEKLLEEREAWIRNMADNVPVMIWVAGLDKNFTFLNKTWLSFTGRSLTKETGIGWTEGIHKDDLGTVLSTYHESFEKKEPFTIEHRVRRYDGEFRWVLNNAVPQYDSQGMFTGYTGSCTEIHDKRVMNEELEERVLERTAELQEANVNLEQSNGELAQFAYIASHDLQEPLRKIITFSNRLKERYSEAIPLPANDFVEKIKSSSERMRTLIDNLLKFSRISQADKIFPLTDLTVVLKEVLTDFDLLIQEKKAVINAAKLPVIQAIPLQMNQLFYNLLSNALKFTNDEVSPVITIECRLLTPAELKASYPRFDPLSEYYEITVADNGIGFPQEFAEQIFIIFQRLNQKGHFPGTGIGLALCRKIIRNHGGDIFAQSEEGKDTVFRIIIPARQPEPSPKE